MSPLVLLLSSAAWAGPIGPGIAVSQVTAPPQLLEGVQTLQVGPIQGQGGDGVVAEIKAAYADEERQFGMGTVGDVASGVLKAGAEIGGQMLASQLGGGFGGKLAGGLATGTANMAADAVAEEKLVLDDGLVVNPFHLVDKGGQGQLTGTMKLTPRTENFTKEVDVKDKNGNVVKDADGKVLKKTVSCTTNSVTANLTWKVTVAGADQASGTTSRDASDTHCQGDDGKLATTDALSAVAVQGHGAQIVAEIAPAWRSFRIDLKKSPDLRYPVMLTKKGQHDEALCAVHHMTSLEQEDFKAPFNEGALLEALGHYTEAAAAYQVADDRKGGSFKPAEKAGARAIERKDSVDAMVKAYGLDWKIGAPPFEACPAMPDGRPTMAKKSLDLLDKPDGATLQTLEKGERLFVMAEEGKLVKVQLIDGTEGYVPAKAVK